MIDIPDDPIIRCIEQTGYPPWYIGYHGIVKGEDDDPEQPVVDPDDE